MTTPRIFAATSYRLSALYLCLFLLSFLSISGVVYFLTCQTLEQQLKNNIEAEIMQFRNEFAVDGIKAVREEIGEKERIKSKHIPAYGLADADGKILAGSLHNFSLIEGWQRIVNATESDSKKTVEETEILYIRVIPLSPEYWLAVGDDGEFIQDAGEAIIEAFLWGALLVLVFGSFGGVYLSRAFLSKINNITHSTQAIIAGDLKHRLPVTKGNDELDRLASLLNRMLDKIHSLIENIQQISNDIAHDLRTPISRLKYKLDDVLKKDLNADEYKQYILSAIGEVDTILDTFSAMLRISQIESGSRRSGFKDIDLSDIVLSVAEALHPVAEEQGKTLIQKIDDAAILTGDKELLTQLVYNLTENAIVHTFHQTQIAMELKAGNPIELVISDNGSGIPEEYREKVFQRFYRLEQSRGMRGNGLGLSIVAAIAELHGASINLQDNRPGLQVVITFPKG